MAVRFAPAQWRWCSFLLAASLVCVALVLVPASTAENNHKRPRAILTGSSIEVVQTSANLSDPLTRLPDLRFSGSRPNRGPVIKVDDAIRDQAVTGVGAAMTDSSAWLLHDELAPATRTAVMNDLFDVQGAHLEFMLVPMGGSDFTAKRRPCTYDDVPAGKSDPGLPHFSVAHDDGYIIPTLRQMLAINHGSRSWPRRGVRQPG
jgi:glucosylceramidase